MTSLEHAHTLGAWRVDLGAWWQQFAGYHLLLVLLKMALDSPARYPAALQCPAWSLASIAIFALALRPDADRPSLRSLV
jgi:hypothetical protein